MPIPVECVSGEVTCVTLRREPISATHWRCSSLRTTSVHHLWNYDFTAERKCV